jgi:hypothetical protein
MLSVLDNTTLRKIPVPKREKITGGCRQLPNKDHDLYSSSEIRVIKSRARDGHNMYGGEEKCMQVWHT